MKRTPLRRKTPLKNKSTSGSSNIKDRIQSWLRAIVIQRDGGCIARDTDWHRCNGFTKDGKLILQADHLITRANSATYADTRLVVCVCKGLHGWKSLGNNKNKEQYDALIKELLPPDRVALWDRALKDSWRPHRKYEYDWRVEEAALKQEYRELMEASISPSIQYRA